MPALLNAPLRTIRQRHLRYLLAIDVGGMPKKHHNKAGVQFVDRPGRREAADGQPLSSTLYQSQSDQQDNRADEGVDDRGDHTATDYYADLRQQPASEQTAENANDDVAYQPVATAFDHHTGKPTSDGTDDQPNDECLYVHLFPPISARPERACAFTASL
jgi:hypothetical protein